MAPGVRSDEQLASELAKTVREVFAGPKRDELTVNLVRSITEERLGLAGGFFKHDAWKAKSKQIIRETVDKIESELIAPGPPAVAPKDEAEAKTQARGRKRAAGDESSPPKKKRQITKPRAAKKKSESELSDLDESDVSAGPTMPKRPAKRGGQRARRTVTSDSEEDDEQDDDSAEEDEEQEDSDEFDSSGSEPKPKKAARNKNPPKKGAPKKDTANEPELETGSSLSEPADEGSEKPAQANKSSPADESSESEVFDEPPKPKRKSKDASSAKASARSSKAKSSKTKSAADLSPDAAEIKKLQGQLLKCGVRKIWGIELKQYGDDSRAKIRHLRDMLKEVGMDGRFSEQKAREIKERRELLADLEAVQEMNEHLDWGSGGGRASRSRAARPKKLVVDDGSEDDEDKDDDGTATSPDDGGDDDESPRDPRARARAKRRADFAFLGDDDESD